MAPYEQWGRQPVDTIEITSRPARLSPDIVELFEEVGLTRKEIEIYEYLLTSGGAMPSSIARDTGQPRGRIYEGMRNLVAKGFASERPTRPILFSPAPLPDVLSAAQARLTRHLHAVRTAQAVATAARGAALVTPASVPMRMRDVSVLSGRRACYAEITRMLETAGRFFWISGGGHFAGRLANMPSLLEAAHNASARGVDVKIIVPRAPVPDQGLKLIDAGRSQPLLCVGAPPEAGTLVSCANELGSLELISQPDDDAPTRGDDVAVHISEPQFGSRMLDRLTLRVRAPHLANLPSVFPWLSSANGADVFGDAVRTAKSEVQVFASPDWSTYMGTHWEREAAAHSAAAQRGVLLRLVASPNSFSERLLASLENAWQIRVVAQLPPWVTIVDSKELYQAFPHASIGGLPQFRRSEEAHEIKFYQGIFEHLWAGGSAPAPAPIPLKVNRAESNPHFVP